MTWSSGGGAIVGPRSGFGRRQFMKGMLLGGSVLVLPAWSRSFEIVVAGHTATEVTFSFLDRGESLEIDLIDLSVNEQSGNEPGAAVWYVRGRHACTGIAYGAHLDGLETVVPPKALVRDKRYVVTGTAGATWLSPVGYSRRSFGFDPLSGTVT